MVFNYVFAVHGRHVFEMLNYNGLIRVTVKCVTYVR